MAVTQYAPGKIKPILYFVNAQGYIHLLPTDEDSKRFRKQLKKLGFEMQEADTLRQAEWLQKTMQEQLYNEQQAELARDEAMTTYRRQQVKDRLTAKMNSSSTNQTEKDFIRCWLVMRDQKHDIMKKRFTSQIGHLDALEFDDPNQHIHDLHDRVK